MSMPKIKCVKCQPDFRGVCVKCRRFVKMASVGIAEGVRKRAEAYLEDAPHMEHYECYELIRDLLAELQRTGR